MHCRLALFLTLALMLTFLALTSADVASTTEPKNFLEPIDAEKLKSSMLDLLHKFNETASKLYEGLSAHTKEQVAEATKKLQETIGEVKTQFASKKEATPATA